MVCVICSSGKNRPDFCPPFGPLSVSLTLSLFHFLTLPSSSQQQRQQPMCSICTFLCVCLFGCVYFTTAGYGLYSYTGLCDFSHHCCEDTHVHREREGGREKCWHCCILQLWDTENIRLSVNSHMLIISFTWYHLLYFVTNSGAHLDISQQTLWYNNWSVSDVNDRRHVN